MDDVVICVENLSKQYRIGQRDSKNLRETLMDSLSAPFHRLLRFGHFAPRNEKNQQAIGEYFWALKDVSFQVKRGEVLGIIGRNGAGKSTLLKILSRITEPTEGCAKIQGRVGTLLEVGTGFHPELTGRENVFLNGAILGMKKAEIERKLDDIVSFAETGKFIDTPVKHYSSGMYMRLAFAIAAHLEPEILIVDEVLAVGDAAFQRKSLGKMSDVAKEGRTVLFVSHNMGAIAQLCERVAWLESGMLVEIGQVENVARNYMAIHTVTQGEWTNSRDQEKIASEVEIRTVRLVANSKFSAAVALNSPFQIEVDYLVRTPISDCILWLRLATELGTVILTTLDTDSTDWAGRVRSPGWYRSICEFPAFFLKPQSYLVSIGAGVVNRKIFEDHEDILQFEVTETGGFALLPSSKRSGVVMPRLPWRVSGPS